MPKVNIIQKTIIASSIEKVYDLVVDFHHWPIWSPWICLDTSCQVNVNEDGKYYDWEGKVVGAGNMTVLKTDELKSIDYDLTFLKPWKSKASIRFELQEVSNGVEVKWIMNSSLPFFLFWMKKMMVAYVGMDFKRGLLRLKELAEFGKIRAQMDFKGITTVPKIKYIAKRTESTFDGLSDSMSKDFERLMPYMIQNHKEKISGPAFSEYHKFDMINGKVIYSACIPINEIPEDLPSDYTIKERPEMRVNSIDQVGPYNYIGDAWSAQYQHAQAKQFAINKKVDPIEVYLNSPKDTPEEDLKITIQFPVK